MWRSNRLAKYILAPITLQLFCANVLGQSTTTTSTSPVAVPTICGDIIGIANEDLDNNWLFYATDVYQCLTSVPFLDAVATRYINYWNTTIQFQSTLAYLKSPPSSYQQPPVDVQQVVDEIAQNITSGLYGNEYDFEASLWSLIQQMHDAHVDLNSGILSAFSFGSPYDIMSISIDGKQAPQIYVATDVVYSPSQGWTPSAITTINGQNVVQYLENFAAVQVQGSLEPHGDWNQLMYSPIQDILGTYNVFGWNAVLYPGDDLILGFANGTSQDIGWFAYYLNNEQTGPLTTGGDFYNYFVLGLLPASFVANVTNSTAVGSGNSTNISSWNDISSAYPDNPAVVQPGLSVGGDPGILTGYYLTDVSTGVLSIPNFSDYGSDADAFSNTTAEFIQGARAAGLTKIVIDLQGNYGGDIVLAFDTFQQFFPSIQPYGGSRRRDHYNGNILGGAMTDFYDSLDPNDPNIDYEYYHNGLAANEWVVTDRLDAATGQNFTSWVEYYGPVHVQGDQFSLTERYDIPDAVFDYEASDGFIPESVSNQSPPWSSQDIIILTDGSCSSTCSLFVEMMTHDAGVRTVVVGGQPITGPMQAVSGSRGARFYSADDLDENFQFAGLVNETANVTLPQNREQAIYTFAMDFNLRDQLRPNDNEPLQFKYLAADCRIYYTFANAYNMSRLWRDAAAAIWTDPSLCVAGSTGYAASGNSTTTNPPPVRTAQPSTANVRSGRVVQSPAGFGDPISDGTGPRSSGDFQPCTSSCSSGDCVTLTINGKDQSFCAQGCDNPGQACGKGNKGVCTDAAKRAETKSNTVSSSTSNQESSGGIYLGHCVPNKKQLESSTSGTKLRFGKIP